MERTPAHEDFMFARPQDYTVLDLDSGNGTSLVEYSMFDQDKDRTAYLADLETMVSLLGYCEDARGIRVAFTKDDQHLGPVLAEVGADCVRRDSTQLQPMSNEDLMTYLRSLE